MKFLIVTNHSYMLWQFRRELIGELLKMGEVAISVPFLGHEEDFQEMGCKCINTKINRRGINPFEDFKLFRTYNKILKEEKPDVVITYSIKPNIYAGFLCRLKKIPYSVNVQGLGTAFQSKLMSIVASIMYKAGLKKSNVVFFENTANAKDFTDRNIIPESKVLVLNGAGVNLELYKNQPYPEEDDGVHIMYLGRIMKEKGCSETFEAMRIVKEKYGDKVVFDVVGFFEDEYKDEVEKMVEDGVIVFHGFQPDPKPYYASAHCVVLASYHEGMSNVLLEAASTSRAVITSDIPGCREAVDEGVTGYLCKKQDVDTIVKAMEEFLSLSKEDRVLMGKKGREKMEREFEKYSVVEKTIKAVLNDKY